MIKLLIATRNPAKVREYSQLLACLPLRLVSLVDEQITLIVEETGQTFAENAKLKASQYASASGLLTLADDSGLEVEALNGAPGVRSARYAGPRATNADRIRLLLQQLQDFPWEKRAARFRCAIAVATPTNEVYLSEGRCDGVISFEPRGKYGFGYDPVFFLPEYNKTMAELRPEEKDRLSHRAKAAQGARAILQQLLVAAETSFSDQRDEEKSLTAAPPDASACP
ncbi:MAG: XTP/dITP diphosphatase [Chloroflexi bacterium]|nr:XTP/dITP diphosphatase [Chloroflexota bacterium]MCL5075055.1 XTP/dITP diphosphatase [Chloroflexota bacterium]